MWPVKPAERVAEERRLRGHLSIRQVSAGTSTSNETWSKFERTGIVTPKIRLAVAEAFGWPSDWPEQLPPLPPPEAADALSRLEVAVRALADETAGRQQVEDLSEHLVSIAAQLQAQGATLERLAGLLDRQTAQPRRAAT